MFFPVISPRFMNPPLLLLALVALGPLSLLAFGMVPNRFAHRDGRRFAGIASWLSLGVFGVAVLAFVGRFLAGPLVIEVAGAGPLRLDVYFDTLSAVMLLLVSFLGAVVVRYSGNYLAGDPQQGRFIKWLCVTIGSVLLLTVSGNLLMFTLAWVATSMSLHQLLTFYPDRPAAMLAARKKFLFSRLGDACLVGVARLKLAVLQDLEFCRDVRHGRRTPRPRGRKLSGPRLDERTPRRGCAAEVGTVPIP